MRLNKKHTLIVIATILAIMLCAAYIMLPKVLTNVRAAILSESADFLEAQLEMGDLRLSGITAVEINDIKITKDNQVIADIPKIRVGVSPFKVIFGKDSLQAIDEIQIDRAVLNLVQDKEHKWNVQTILKPLPETDSALSANIIFKDATVNIDIPNSKWKFAVAGSVDARSDKTYAMDINAESDNVGNFKVEGILDKNIQGKLIISSPEVNLLSGQSFLKTYVPIDNLSGIAKNLKLIWQAEQDKTRLNGQLNMQNVGGKLALNDPKVDVDILANGKLLLADNVLQFDAVQLLVNEQVLGISGKLDFNNPKLGFKQFKIQADKLNLEKLLPSQNITGIASVTVVSDGVLPDVTAQGVLNLEAGNVKGYEVKKATVPFTLLGGQLFIKDAQAQALDGNVLLNGQYTIKDNTANITAEMGGVDLANLNIDKLSGIVNAKVYTTGKISANDLNIGGTVELDKLSYQAIPVDNVKIDFSKNKEQVYIKSAVAQLGNSGQLALSGALDTDNIDVNMSVANLPLDYLGDYFAVKAQGTMQVFAQVTGKLANPMVSVSAKGGNSNVAGHAMEAFTADVVLMDKKLNIKDFHVRTAKIMQLPNGEHRMSGLVDFSDNIPKLDLTLYTKRARVDNLSQNISDSYHLTGFLDNNLHIAGDMDNLAVDGSMRLYEGSIQGVLLDEVKGNYKYKDKELDLDGVEITSLQAKIYLNGKMLSNGDLRFKLLGHKLDLTKVPLSKEFTPTGLVDFDGAIKGNIKKPIFTGDVKSNKITFRGQDFTDLEGSVWTDAGINTALSVSFRQEQGSFDFQGGIDLLQSYAYGKISAKNADVQNLLELAQEDIQVAGLLDGDIVLNRRGKGTGLEIVGGIKQGKIKDLPLQDIQFDISVTKNKFNINKFEALQGTAGKILATGHADFAGDIDIQVGASKLDAQLLTALMQEPMDFTGNMDVLMQLSGTTKKPDVAATMQISNGTIKTVGFDNLYLLASLQDNENINLQQVLLEKGQYKVTAYGDMPLDIFRRQEQRSNKNSQMDIKLSLENADLNILPLLTNKVDFASGPAAGNLSIRGDFKKPKIYGSIKTQNAMLKFGVLYNPITDLNLDVQFEGDKFYLKDLSANMGKGQIKALGNLNIDGWELGDYKLDVSVDKIPLDSEIVTGPLSAKINIAPQAKRNGAMRPKISGEIFLDNIVVSAPAFPEFQESKFPDVGIDIKIDAGKNIKMYNHMLYDLDLEGDLHAKGSLNFPVINGNIKVKKGTINYLRTPFKVRYAMIGFPIPGSLTPNVTLYTTSRLFRTNIFLSVRGPLDALEFNLSSDPPLSQQELFRMLTLKTQAGNNSSVGNDVAVGLLTTGLQMSILGEAEEYVRNKLGLAEFRFYQGEIMSGMSFELDGGRTKELTKEEREQYNVLVSKYVTDKFLVGFTSSFDAEHYTYYMQYEVNPHINFSVGMDQDKKYRYGVEYRISF